MQPSYAIMENPGLESDRFRLLVDQAPFMLWSAGNDGQYTFFNRPWLEFRGRTMDQEVGSGWVEGIHPDDRQRYTDAYKRAAGAHEPLEIEYRLKRSDGQFCWVRE